MIGTPAPVRSIESISATAATASSVSSGRRNSGDVAAEDLLHLPPDDPVDGGAGEHDGPDQVDDDEGSAGPRDDRLEDGVRELGHDIE